MDEGRRDSAGGDDARAPGAPRPRPGAPRRPSRTPARSRAREGGSARAVPPSGTAGPRSGAPGAADERPRGVRHRATPPAGTGRPDPVATRVDLRPVDEDAPASAGGARTARGRARRSTPTSRTLSRIPRPLRLGAAALVLVLLVTTAWFTGLAVWANGRIEHVDALSDKTDTPGVTYLIAGSDRRGGAVADDGTTGERADTLMLMHKAPNGRTYLVSLPRDTLVDIPDKGTHKLNAAYALGGPQLLVATVEGFTGLKIDHFVEIGFDGVEQLVDAVGTVNLCLDQDVDDPKSGLQWTSGCHDTGGEQALAFVRARYFDPTADLGRQKRQQQFVSALMKKVMTPGVLLNPVAQVKLAGAGTGALRTDSSTGIVDLGQMALAMRAVMKDGTTMEMPIKDPDYKTKRSGVAILTDDQQIATFFGSIGDGSAEPPAKTG